MPFDYSRALEVATGAARAAGAILREEFHRSGGPRGERGKAPADIEAEQEIRGRLLAAFPGWGYRGEETGDSAPRRDADGSTHCWLVDPNDGTTSFQRGYRGPAVSIALLHDSVPALGVVYSFCAPDDSGDLLCWAEGCGPLRRNGAPVEGPAWPGSLGCYDVVLRSRGADRRPRSNAEAVAPARFLAVPSIAYRLALVAAGEAAATFALHAPGDREMQSWDYAAGHALLRGIGGELVDEGGLPVRYAPGGDGQLKACFGGAPEVVRELLQRNLRHLPTAPLDPDAEYGPVQPVPGDAISDAALLSRAHGCLLGQVAGDALGNVEFETAQIPRDWYTSGRTPLRDGGCWDTLAGQPTDDSEMALLLGRTLAQNGIYDPGKTAAAYRYWLRSDAFDIGLTIAHALRNITEADVAAGRAADVARRSANTESQANGCLMRISPLGIWGHARAPEEVAAAARADASLTHPHPVCLDATAVYAVAVAHAVATGVSPRAVWEYACGWAKSRALETGVQDTLAAAAERPPSDYTTWAAGWVLVALQNAFYQLLHAPGFEEGVLRTVAQGGDTDTNAAIAGALLGAVHGRESIPRQWRQMVLSCRPIEGLANVLRPRPRSAWPVDALVLAERLLCAGKQRR